MMANVTLTLHAAGWLEGGLTFGYEKFINDIEALQIAAELAVKPKGNAAEIGFDAIADVEPGGHFFATQQTMDRYGTEFYQPLVADLQNVGAWAEAGSKTSAERATEIWKRVLADYQKPPTGNETAERLKSYIESGKKAGGQAPME